MNHNKVYNDIISNAKTKNRIKLKKNQIGYTYYENHHIIPKCLGGLNENENLILLTAREHYICHKLLTYIYKKNPKIYNAFFRMTFDKKGNYNISSKDYAYARELKSIANNIGLKGKKRSEEFCKKQSEQRKGKGNPMFGKHQSEKSKQNISKNHASHNEEHRKHLSEVLKGKNKGRKHTEETKEKNRQAHLGKIPWNKGIPATEEQKEKNRKALCLRHAKKDKTFISPSIGEI